MSQSIRRPVPATASRLIRAAVRCLAACAFAHLADSLTDANGHRTRAHVKE